MVIFRGGLLVFYMFVISSSAFAQSSLEDFQKQIKLADSVESAVSRFPTPMRKNFLLIKESQSAQFASPDAPRVITFNDKADLVAAFTSVQDKKGSGRLEVIHYNPQTFEQEFYKVDFANGRPNWSEKNPRECLACHGTRPHIIWGSYPFWKGAYGENDDFLGQTQLSGKPLPLTEEQVAFAALKATWSTNARLKSLMIEGEHADAPYAPHLKPSDLTFRPNFRFGMLIASLEAKRIANEYIHSPYYEATVRPLLTSFIGESRTFRGRRFSEFSAFLPCVAEINLYHPWNAIKTSLHPETAAQIETDMAVLAHFFSYNPHWPYWMPILTQQKSDHWFFTRSNSKFTSDRIQEIFPNRDFLSVGFNTGFVGVQDLALFEVLLHRIDNNPALKAKAAWLDMEAARMRLDGEKTLEVQGKFLYGTVVREKENPNFGTELCEFIQELAK